MFVSDQTFSLQMKIEESRSKALLPTKFAHTGLSDVPVNSDLYSVQFLSEHSPMKII